MNSRISSRAMQGGFTILELMIATLVFSMVLLLITVGVISFNETYYKGIVQSTTQNAARTVIENASQAIQFSSGKDSIVPTNSTNSSNGYCIGDERYSFVAGYQLVNSNKSTDQTYHALVLDSLPGCYGGSKAQDLLGNGSLTKDSTELLGQKMRLAKFNITALANNLYLIDVRVAYGDNDLLCSPSKVPGSCTSTATMPAVSDFAADDLRCKSDLAGSQFCAVSELTTTVQKRIN